MQSDEQMRAALARLTANEKECLRRRLLPQTAKEMAIDLGVSPHAVEKRLKMARAKLGVSSSVAAARLLASVERYDPPVPYSPDLSRGPGLEEAEHRAAPVIGLRSRSALFKGSIMLIAFWLIALASQDAQAPVSPPSSPKVEHLQDIATRKVGMNEAAAFIRMGFPAKDKDGSGYLDPGEASAMEPRDRSRDTSLPPAPPIGSPDPAAERKWMAKLDTDRDGKVSEEEYVSYLLPWILWQGVPADWHPAPQSGQR